MEVTCDSEKLSLRSCALCGSVDCLRATPERHPDSRMAEPGFGHHPDRSPALALGLDPQRRQTLLQTPVSSLPAQICGRSLVPGRFCDRAGERALDLAQYPTALRDSHRPPLDLAADPFALGRFELAVAGDSSRFELGLDRLHAEALRVDAPPPALERSLAQDQ